MNNPVEKKTADFLKEPISRRDFVSQIIRGGLLTTLAAMILPALAYVWPVMRRGPSTGMKDVGALDEIPIGGSKKVVIDGSVLLIVRTADAVKAFSAICTHLGCVVFWDEQKKQIACPCHAGYFDLEGRVVAGPPPRPLPGHDVSVVNGKILVKV